MIILPFASPAADLANTGGKGASLARLTRLGLPVPPGFFVTTEAYRSFVAANALAGVLAPALAGLSAEDAAGLERASARIRSAFSAGKLPEEIAGQVVSGYRALGPQAVPVAVRSSATTEDLPDLSFAGQQDTYLNIVGKSQLLEAMVDCWSSLWTARAIGYRLRNSIPHEQAALAVVVQEMVPSEVSGVLFTANPLTGLLSESVIDATFGLGEALVSGQVEPDHFVVDPAGGAIRSLRLGAKTSATRSKAGGGVESLPEEAAGRQTLTEEQVRRLVAAGRQVQEEYGLPQDIEWAFAGGELFILQSRPITSLFPIPQVSFDPLVVWFSFGAVQGMVGPMTPLGQESIARVVLGIGKKLGLHIEYEDQDIFAIAGERIWVKISDLIRHPLGSGLFSAFLGFVEPSVGQILRQLAAEPRLGAGKGRFKLSTLRRSLGFFLPIAVDMVKTMLHPERARERFDVILENYLQSVRIPAGADRFERLANFAAFMEGQGGLADALPTLLPRFLSIFAPAMASLNQIGHLLPKKDPGDHGFSMSVLEVTRGLPRNVTTEMDLALWGTATAIRADAAAAQAFGGQSAPQLAARYLEGTLPPAAQSAVGRFMDRYGVRGVGEIDLGQPRWREEPTPVMRTLQSYLQIDPAAAPDVLFEKGAAAAEQAIQSLAAEARRQPGGRIKEKQLRAAASRVRLLMGARESPKFLAVRAMGMVRGFLLAVGEEFAAAGTIDRPDDLFYLHTGELDALSRQEDRDWKGLVAQRRQSYERELRRRQVPRLLVSDGRAFFEGIGAGSDTGETISGSPVSPGVVEGVVHVVFDPRTTQLAPGEILVCPGTDPAWTPLFMAAGGLVMEVGGMMTHGSVVAREYGIPAVVGVHQATERLKDGQRIRVDGTAGRIKLLPPSG
ncbi:MAG TPA: PEP/pyruvate-binding domain-containing protein [Anaerolineales bacterium]|nr:PEP/pyruvate-binding domain-containing protein [Anaerolineales bacterium]